MALYSYRQDPNVPDFPDDRPIMVFDGLCLLCSWGARFLMKQDRKAKFRLSAAQSPLGVALYRHYDLDIDQSFILIDGGEAWTKSDAVIRIGWRLGGIWVVSIFLAVLPKPLRDRLYDYVAATRYRFFGRSETCFLPEPGQVERFL